LIDGLIITDLHKFSNENGSVYHGMRKTDPGYNGFEEIYFSYIKPGSLKAWKMHKKMTLNLVVPVGDVRFNFIEVDNKRNINERYEIIIGTSNYSRITVPPGIIFGFKGLSDSINIVTNISNLIHDDNECENIDKKSFEFK
jgi:dTDP-4-dehydrorhamnose 3,5-epimerase|tara:strand:- start:117 stop:539 length:423 start_codon:yes stop_codon:yes gene_type:complete